MSFYWILIDGEPVATESMEEWGRWFEKSREERIVARDEFAWGRVSTVFLGLDHDFSRLGPPLLYETLVFGSPLHDEGARYATRTEALAGHAAVVARARAAIEAADAATLLTLEEQ